jgi:hypothetical protein
MCELKARKQQKKRGKNSQLCQQHGPKLLAKLSRLTQVVGKAVATDPGCWQSWAFPLKRGPALPTASAHAVGKALCQPDFADSRRFPVGERNGSRADGVPPSPTVHVAVGEAFPIGPAFLLAKSSFPSLKTPMVLSQQELGNPVGKAFANRVGVFANSSKLLAKHAFPVVICSFLPCISTRYISIVYSKNVYYVYKLLLRKYLCV